MCWSPDELSTVNGYRALQYPYSEGKHPGRSGISTQLRRRRGAVAVQFKSLPAMPLAVKVVGGRPERDELDCEHRARQVLRKDGEDVVDACR